MSDPFRSDYISSAPTRAAASVDSGAKVDVMPPATGVVAGDDIKNKNIARGADVGFNPELYGLGKPRRIVIRGKISIG